jgi:site-specific recombinase XerC
MEMGARVTVTVVRLSRSRNGAGELVVRLGVGLLDEYLEFLGGRCRPNTVLAVAYDLKVFFTVVGKPPRRVRPADVLAFMTAQRTGGDGRLRLAGVGAGGVSARTLRWRLSSVAGFYGFLMARGDVSVNPVPRGLPARRERQRPGQGVPLVRSPRTLPRFLDPAEVDMRGCMCNANHDIGGADRVILRACRGGPRLGRISRLLCLSQLCQQADLRTATGPPGRRHHSAPPGPTLAEASAAAALA